MDFDFSEIEELHKKTFDQAIDIIINHYDTWVKDDTVKLKTLTQIKKETEQLTNLFGGKNVDSN
jgi:hypothetical protein